MIDPNTTYPGVPMTPKLASCLERVAQAALAYAEKGDGETTPRAMQHAILEIVSAVGSPKRRMEANGRIHVFPWERDLDESAWAD